MDLKQQGFDFISVFTCLVNNRGCMGMTAFYGSFDREAHEEESLKTITTALEIGINFLDTAWIYQVGSPCC